MVRDDESTFIGHTDSLLTGPSSGSPSEVALAYARDRGEVFDLRRSDFANLELMARDVSPDGITHLRFNQVLDGARSFDRGGQ